MSDVERGRRLRKRATLGGALLLGGLPLWMLPLMVAGAPGFVAYLTVSHIYYAGARALFGATLFPAREFGIIPNGAPGMVLAALLYGFLGAMIGRATAELLRRWRRRRS